MLETALGELEVGIREGTAAWLDVSASFGSVRNALDAADAPGAVAPRPSRCARPHRADRRRSRSRQAHDMHADHGATGLRKSYGEQVVLDGIDLDVAEGTVFALLGPNGAGKTTTVQILSTLIGADAGERARRRPRRRRASPTRCAPRSASPASSRPSTTCSPGSENLILMADLHHLGQAEGRRRAAELLERFDLVDAADKPAATYSGGMRRRLDLAMTLVGDPRIIFLDEPTTGLDPRSRRTMWEIIRELVAGGVTIFLTTQYLEEADQLADRIAVLDRGRLVAEGTPAELKRLRPRRPHPAAVRRRRASSTRPPRALDGADARRRRAHPAGPERRQPCRRCAPCSTGSTSDVDRASTT